MPRLVARRTRLLAEFLSADALLDAVRAMRREAYHDLDVYTPFDVPGLDDALGERRSRLGWLVLGGGIAGLLIGYWVQWFANAWSDPLAVGGRPAHAVPAFVPATFEATVLGAALAAFFGLLMVLRFPKLWAPEDELDGLSRAASDRFWLVAETFGSEHDRAHAADLVRDAGANRVMYVEW